MKQPIHKIAASVLAQHQKPMSADDIFAAILQGNLYEFKAKSPLSVLRAQLRRHSRNINTPNKAKELLFEITPDGLFTLGD